MPPEEINGVEASISSGKIELQDPSNLPDSEKQPLFQIPKQKKFQVGTIAQPTSAAYNESRPKQDEPKVIFATGGITNGKQATEVLNAGANVAMVYTALVYSGVGTISRIKDEMRMEMRKSGVKTRS